jgi:alpha-mannosidase
MIPHTHDDVGWLKTMDEYFSGSNQGVHHAQVDIILDNVVEEMIKRPNTRFTYVEMKFFTMWYDRQSPQVKAQVKALVKEGRFEFINGGWTANDEACPNYEDIIDNMMIGHSFLKDEFDTIPRAAWLLDSFGHSAGNARLYADMGLEGLFVGRLDKRDNTKRYEEGKLTYLWRPFSKHFGDEKQILVNAFKDHYCWPPGFFVDERYDAD